MPLATPLGVVQYTTFDDFMRLNCSFFIHCVRLILSYHRESSEPLINYQSLSLPKVCYFFSSVTALYRTLQLQIGGEIDPRACVFLSTIRIHFGHNQNIFLHRLPSSTHSLALVSVVLQTRCFFLNLYGHEVICVAFCTSGR